MFELVVMWCKISKEDPMSMKKHSSTRAKSLFFLPLFLFASICAQLIIIAPPAEAIDSIQLRVINKTEITLENLTFSRIDYDNLNSSIKDVWGDASAAQAGLRELYSGKTFLDSDIWDSEDDYRVTVERAGESCEGEIDYDVPYKAGGSIDFTVRLRVPLGNGSCPVITTRNDRISVSNQGNLIRAFTWLDETTMRPYQRPNTTYTKDPNRAGRYNNDLEEGRGACRDFVETIDFENGTFSMFRTTFGPDDGGECELWNPWIGEATTMPIKISNLEARSNPPGTGRDNADEEGEEETPSCESENPGISLSWFICSVIQFLDNTVTGLAGAVEQLLEVDSSYYSDNRLRRSWSYFRNIASFMLILIGLVMIIGQAVSKE